MTDRHLIGGMLNFAAEILAARETVRFTMGEGGGAVLREEAIAHLPGIALNLDQAWMRIERLREMGPPDLPEMFDGWIEGKLGNPETRPQLRAERMLRVSIEEASDLVEAGLADAESCFPIRTENPKTGDVGIVEGEVMVRLAIARLDEFRGLFENWVASAWMPWAAEEARGGARSAPTRRSSSSTA